MMGGPENPPERKNRGAGRWRPLALGRVSAGKERRSEVKGPRGAGFLACFLETPPGIGYTPVWIERRRDVRRQSEALAPREARSADQPRRSGQLSSAARGERVLQPRKVLVVDDSKLMHKMYEVMLRQYPLVYALDGRQALDRLQEHSDIDLVLLDINMPNMNGLEFLAQIPPSEERNFRVIIISTEGRDEDTQRGLEAGANAYIKKPFHSEDILEKISQL